MHSGTTHAACVLSPAQLSCPPCTCAGERRRRGKGDRRATEITKAIRNCLEQTILVELMPRSQIDVYVQVLQVGSLRGVE